LENGKRNHYADGIVGEPTIELFDEHVGTRGHPIARWFSSGYIERLL
jgi:hypothetical protein